MSLRRTWSRPRNCSPAQVPRSRLRRPLSPASVSEGAVRDGMPMSSNAEARNVTPSRRNGKGCQAAHNAAPTGGPTKPVPVICAAMSRAFVRSSSWSAASRGTTACAAQSKNTSATPEANARSTSVVTDVRPVDTPANSSSIITQRARSEPTMDRRPGMRSTRVPMTGASNQAARPAAATTDTQNTSPVLQAAMRGSAANRAPSPTELSALAVTSRRRARVRDASAGRGGEPANFMGSGFFRRWGVAARERRHPKERMRRRN